MNNSVFQQNIISLSSVDPELAFKISQVSSSDKCRIDIAKNSSPVPVIKDTAADIQLHSLYNPEREGEKLYLSGKNNSGFVIFFGLGGGYHILPYLNDPDIHHILIIEKDKNILRKIIENIDLTNIFSDRKTDLLVDPDIIDLQNKLAEKYNPSIFGNLSIVQLKNRVKTETVFFENLFMDIKIILDSVYDDFAVQAQFGKRWFRNTLMNLSYAEEYSKPISPSSRIMIAGAGPSIEKQLDTLKANRDKSLLIATDTVLPYLSGKQITPDIIISIDCQHITYNHFMGIGYSDIPVVLDLSSQPYISRKFKNRSYFSSGHPFSRYIATYWKYFPVIDTSGGNVGHSAVSLAKSLGAREIELYGLDYSYPKGKPYARDSLIYNYFMKTENRKQSCENNVYNFVFSNSKNIYDGNIVTNSKLDSYYSHISDYIRSNCLTTVTPEGSARDLSFRSDIQDCSSVFTGENHTANPVFFGAGSASVSWKDFLYDYSNKLKHLPAPDSNFKSYYQSLSRKEKELWTTVFPVCASVRKEHREEKIQIPVLLEESRSWCINEILKYI